jgi:SPP1 family predicted phage head-tail adaptor
MTLQPFSGERIGNLRDRVTIRELVETLDDYGQPIQTWQEVATVWARVEPLKGDERFAAQQIIATAAYRVHIRYRDDVTVLHSIRWNDIDLDITSISNADERKRYLALECSVVNP